MIDSSFAWLGALAFLSGYGIGKLRHLTRKLRDRELMRERQLIMRWLNSEIDRATTPKPDIIPKPQFPSPRKIREDFLP